jgi:hypothetical protein
VWLHLLEMHQTQTYAKYVRMAPPRPAETLPTPAETNNSHTGRLYEKTLQEHPRSCKASGATPAGALARPHGTALHPGGKTVPSASISLYGILTDTTADARVLLSGTTIGVLKNRGKTHFLSQKTKHKRTHKRKTHPRQSRLSSRGPRSWRPQRPTRTVSPSHPRAKLRFARGAQHHTIETPPRLRAGRPPWVRFRLA